MSKVAIITARGGSKRIPRKNIKAFLGKPIIAYSIETAIQCGLFEKVIVSTDDDEIAAISKKYGAEVPFLRSKETSDDFASTSDVISEVINQLENKNFHFDYLCCIYPTAPFITKSIVEEAYNLLIKGKFNTVFPITYFDYPIYRALKMGEENKVEMIWQENLKKRSQDLPLAYHDAGQFYWVDTKEFKKEQKIISDNSGAIILNELQVQDIDSETDWKLAEMKYLLLQENNK